MCTFTGQEIFCVLENNNEESRLEVKKGVSDIQSKSRNTSSTSLGDMCRNMTRHQGNGSLSSISFLSAVNPELRTKSAGG